MIVDDYVVTCSTYTQKYGQQTCCLYQIGDFFEMNAYYDNNVLCGADIYNICDICNIQVTRKNKTNTEISRSNPLMAGFPLAALSKFTALLLAANYTIVVVRQVTPPPNVTREVTEILSPSTLIIPNTSDANYLLCIYFDEFNAPGNCKKLLSVGISGIDISTGATFVYEAYGSLNDPYIPYDETYRIIESYSPREIIVLCNTKTKDIVNCVETNIQCLIHYSNVHNENKHAFQDNVLMKAYGAQYNHIGLEYYELARISLVAVLQFAYEHNENIIQKLSYPQIIQQSNILTLQYNSAVQLQLVSANNNSNKSDTVEKPLLQILNRCATAFGRRLFKERLLTPIHDTQILEERYNEIDSMMRDNLFAQMHKQLHKIGDIERMCRRMCLGKFAPIDWNTFNDSFNSAIEIMSHNTHSTKYTSVVTSIQRIQEAYTVLDLHECSKYLINDIKGTVFKPNYNDDITSYTNKLNTSLQCIRSFESAINNYETCNIDCNERDGYFINITKKRWDTVKNRTKTLCGYAMTTFTAKPISTSSSVLRLTHDVIDTASNDIHACQKILSKLTTDAYISFLSKFYNDHSKDILYIAQLLASIDISCTCAKNAYEYKYTRPQLVDANANNGSYIYAKDVRHPIIERIHNDVPYISNDVALGNLPETIAQAKTGLLLYGSNSSGKSSYMKSVGLNIIMAQAGMYVAAQSITLAPYKSLFTRIQGNDNVYKRMSTFIVEMTELRNIFQRCNKHSLVLGDELCSGTESVSATAIVAAGTYNLLEKNTTFIFATHLHELIDIPLIKDHVQLQIAHIHVDISPNGVFTYDRKLRDGSGSSIYGVEVCESLGMPGDFIKLAQSVRKHILDIQPIGTKTSKYNSQVFMENCGVCNKNRSSEVHHIMYQCNGGNNDMHNLVPLCTQCHNEEHNGFLKIKGYTMTSEGRKLEYCYKLQEEKPVHTQTQPDAELTQQEVSDIKIHVKYSIAGWFIKKTVKGKWQLSSVINVHAFIMHKFPKITHKLNDNTLSFLKTHLLVV